MISVPTFVINGRMDLASDYCQEGFFRNIPKVKWVTFEESSHCPFWEERQRFMRLVANFLEV
jgi:pimeloyl-ACP methyl ester carboxylesterase